MHKSKKTGVKKTKLCFHDFLHLQRKKKTSKTSKNHESSKLKKVLDIFIEKEENYFNLDDLSAQEWSKILFKFKNELIKNSDKKKFKFIKNKFNSRSEISKAMIAMKEKGDTYKNVTAERIYDKPWVLKLALICVIAFICSVSICRFTPELSSIIIDKTDHILYSKISKLYNRSAGSAKDYPRINESINDKKIFAQYIKNNSNNLNILNKKNNTFLITRDELLAQTAKAASANDNTNKNNDYNILKNNYNSTIQFLTKIFKNISKKQEQISINLSSKLTDLLSE